MEYSKPLFNKLKILLLRNMYIYKVLKLFYIKSRIQYEIICWGGTYLNTIKPLLNYLETNYWHSIKDKREPSFTLFRQLHLLLLKYLFMYKVLKNVLYKVG